MNKPRHENELPPPVSDALAHMLQCEPTTPEIDNTIRRLKSASHSRPVSQSDRAGLRKKTPKLNRLVVAVACCVVFVMCFVASTDAWAQVAQDYSLPANEPQPINTFSKASDADGFKPPQLGIGIRMVLLTHALSLMLGLLSMAITWVIATGKCLIAHRRPSISFPSGRPIEQRFLVAGILLYAAGILAGCVWAQLTWGSPWNWHPKEVFGLFTISVSLLWLASLSGSATQTMRASLATIAFGTVFLMIPLGSHFSAIVHSHVYGGPASAVPSLLTGILVFFGACLAIIGLSRWLANDIRSEPA